MASARGGKRPYGITAAAASQRICVSKDHALMTWQFWQKLGFAIAEIAAKFATVMTIDL